MPHLPNRRTHVTESFKTKQGTIAITVGLVDAKPIEVFYTQRTKVGTTLDDLLYELGVRTSKLMQDIG